jgi:hypothetical protein
MKPLNNSDELWTNLSAKEVEIAEYQAACCLNIRINRQAQVARDPEIMIDNESVPLDTLRKVVEKADHAKKSQTAINEEIKVKG